LSDRKGSKEYVAAIFRGRSPASKGEKGRELHGSRGRSETKRRKMEARNDSTDL